MSYTSQIYEKCLTDPPFSSSPAQTQFNLHVGTLPRFDHLPSHSTPYNFDSTITSSIQYEKLMVCAPSNASPGSKVCHPATLPGSMHNMFLYPSLGSKSPSPLALSIHGFQTTTLLRLSRNTVNLVFPPSTTVTGTTSAGVVPSAGVYTRSTSPEIVSSEVDWVWGGETPPTLSM